MTENAQPTQAADDEIDLRELFSAIWQGKWIIAATTFVFAVLAVIYALSLPNIYKSEALLSPVSQEGG
ncbi:Wzz/FepE/Etk N-terminal domain-containing protein [Alishewanella sp. HL-SH06]|uniref:Wzz/FepE/Etk N-terminal domain-containing protein n=1 Tax=Alishewanella sp. HL-SH06 TaxID=3461144 RepID=UPI00404359CC